MKVIITCGPAYAPIDRVRRITNFSSGKLGIALSNAFARAGHEVICLKGEGSTCPLPLDDSVRSASFATNGDLIERFKEMAAEDGVGAILQVAALCDYEVAEVTDQAGNLHAESKIPSRAGELTIRLKPAPKVLPMLRAMFPAAYLIGWKYELVGTREDAIAAGMRQLGEAQTNLCVVNGAAFGSGFGVLDVRGSISHFQTGEELAEALLARLS
ncbi:MAG TPA: phosphopantothenoylcysteine decarboxylase [Chthoniobacterales bacterium]